MVYWVISIQPNEKEIKKQEELGDIYVYVFSTDTLVLSDLQKCFVVHHNDIFMLVQIGQV